MHLKTLRLKNFRNLIDHEICPAEGFNLFVGNNAQGKTNLIEAIYLLATGHSFRTSEFRDMITRDCLETLVATEAFLDGAGSEIKVRMDQAKKEFFRDSKRTRAGGAKGVSAVLFAPEEILIFKGAPAGRRNYFDVLISQIIPAHAMLVRKYEKVVSQRNNILKDDTLKTADKRSLLKPWDEQLMLLAAKLIEARRDTILDINDIFPEKYSSIAKNDGAASISYLSSCGDVGGLTEWEIAEKVASDLSNRFQDELIRRMAIVGPHRDEFIGKIDGSPIKSFGSQGQCRTFVLAMKISEIEYIKKKLGHMPLLLLDDVTSELDEERVSFLFKYLCKMDCQVFITTTQADIGYLKNIEHSVFEVSGGRAAPRKACKMAICG
jgi:DNA replication and repair protein RecF